MTNTYQDMSFSIPHYGSRPRFMSGTLTMGKLPILGKITVLGTSINTVNENKIRVILNG